MTLRRAVAICGIFCGLAMWLRHRARQAAANVETEVARARRTL